MKSTCRICLSVLLCLCIASCDIRFDKHQWRERDVHYLYRDKMVSDLRKNYNLVGMKYDKVVELLGTPDNYSNQSLRYEIEVDYGSDIDPVYEKTMILTMSEDSMITNLRFEEWKKK